MRHSFFVAGIPRPQGSKRAMRNPYGGGSIQLVEQSKFLKPWRAAIRQAALDAGCQPLPGPASLICIFYFPRPKSHFKDRWRGPLRDTAPATFTAAPDMSKLLRAVEDALSGVVYLDDRQVDYVLGRKMYASHLGPGVSIECEVG